MQTTIETIYRQHIKPLPQSERIKLLAKIAEELTNGEEENSSQQKTASIMELHGLGAEIWKEIDAQEYVNSLRDEWEHRP